MLICLVSLSFETKTLKSACLVKGQSKTREIVAFCHRVVPGCAIMARLLLVSVFGLLCGAVELQLTLGEELFC